MEFPGSIMSRSLVATPLVTKTMNLPKGSIGSESWGNPAGAHMPGEPSEARQFTGPLRN